MSAIKKAGDIGMKAAVLVLLATTVGLLGSTASQFGFLANRRFGGGNNKETAAGAGAITDKPASTKS
jgi:hypothetical protein